MNDFRNALPESVTLRLTRFWRFLRFCIYWIAKDRATQMASALAYRTLIGLLPVVIVATLIFKSVAGQNFTQLVNHDPAVGQGQALALGAG